MEIYEVIKNSKNEIALIITGFAGSLTYTLNKMVNGENISLLRFLTHLITCGFTGYLIYLFCLDFGISGNRVGIMIGIGSYGSIYLINFINSLIKSLLSIDNATSLGNILFELLKRLGKK